MNFNWKRLDLEGKTTRDITTHIPEGRCEITECTEPAAFYSWGTHNQLAQRRHPAQAFNPWLNPGHVVCPEHRYQYDKLLTR